MKVFPYPISVSPEQSGLDYKRNIGIGTPGSPCLSSRHFSLRSYIVADFDYKRIFLRDEYPFSYLDLSGLSRWVILGSLANLDAPKQGWLFYRAKTSAPIHRSSCSFVTLYWNFYNIGNVLLLSGNQRGNILQTLNSCLSFERWVP